MEKKYAQRIHFKRRLLERYNIKCNKFLYRSFIDQIQGGKAKKLLEESNTRSIFEIYYDGEPIWVVYDNARREMRTALPYKSRRVLACII